MVRQWARGFPSAALCSLGAPFAPIFIGANGIALYEILPQRSVPRDP